MSAGRYLVLDLETVVDTELPPPPKKRGGKDGFPPPPYHRIVVLGAALLDATYRLKRIWVVGEGREGELELVALKALVDFLNAQLAKGAPLTVVTWNGRGFDALVLIARCLRHGLALPWYYARDARSRYAAASSHLDLADFLVDHGTYRMYGLDLAAKLIGMPGKLDCKGASVAAMIAAGKLEDVRAYCLQDVANTVALFLRTQLLRGELDASDYARAMERLLLTIEREPRLAPMLPHLNHRRLLEVPGVVERVHAPPASGPRTVVPAEPGTVKTPGRRLLLLPAATYDGANLTGLAGA